MNIKKNRGNINLYVKKNKELQLFFIILLILGLQGCGVNKVVTGSTHADSSITMKNIVKTHQAAIPDFKTLAARVQVEYKDAKKEQSITVGLRMEKDKTIWIKASILGITLAKILITPDRVGYYEKITNTYFDGDFDLLSNWLGTPLDFKKVQDILLGQSIFTLDNAKYHSEVFQNKYKIEPKDQGADFLFTLLLNPDNFKVNLETLSQPDKNRTLRVNYGEYQKIEGDFYPSKIMIRTTENGDETSIDLKYRKIDHNANVRFPFEIPSGYKKIELNV